MAEAFTALSEYMANSDLSNVSNEVFKAKAEEAGVGGGGGASGVTSGAMVFMGTVSELPNNAENGQVYKKYLGVKYELYRNIPDVGTDNFVLNTYNIQIQYYGDTAPTVVATIEEAIAKSGGAPANVKLIFPGCQTEAVYTFTTNKCDIEDHTPFGGPKIWIFPGTRLEFSGDEWVHSSCDVYSSVKECKPYIRFNDEWEPLI